MNRQQTACAHCGGEIGEDGFAKHMADGGEVLDEGYELEEREPVEEKMTEQHESTEIMRDHAFADAIRQPRMAKEMETNPEPEPTDELVSDMERKKRERYGFPKRKAV